MIKHNKIITENKGCNNFLELELQKESLIEQLSQLKSEETQVGKKFQDKYGEGSINIAKGEFTSSN